MIVTVVLTSTAAVGFFVSTLVLLGERNEAERRLKENEESIRTIANDSERTDESVRLMIQDAQKSGGKSLVGYLKSSVSDLAGKVGGSSGDTITSLTARVQSKLDATKASSLMALLDEQAGQIGQLKTQVQDATDAQGRAAQDLKGALDQVASMRKAQQDGAQAQAATIGEWQAKIDEATKKMDDRVKDLAGQIESVRRDAASERTALNDRIAKLGDEKLVLENKVKQLTSERGGDLLKPESEEALVDGQVVGVDLNTGNVSINRGRRDKLSIGMTFQVYTEPTQVRISERTGEYVPGKAVIEIIRLEDKTATARVISSMRGSTVNQGDILVNPLYDPSKSYTFVVFGNFDPEGMGVARPEGAGAIRAMIEQYGGKLSETISGNIDFVVLGERPVLPPQPPSTAPIEVLRAYGDAQKVVKQYDDLFATAAATSTPVLNQNRLFTLMGVGAGRLSGR